MMKAMVLSARTVGINLKKRRFLKLILVFVGVKIVYLADYQSLVCKAPKLCFSHRTIMRRRILPVFAVRIALLLNLFITPVWDRSLRKNLYRTEVKPKTVNRPRCRFYQRTRSFPTAFARLCGILSALLPCRSPLRPW